MTSYRQESLSLARFSLTDYYLSLDCDVLLTEPAAVKLLVEKQLAVVAPMLGSAGLYSNYWGGMTETFYYQRTEQYRQAVLIIHSHTQTPEQQNHVSKTRPPTTKTS